MFYILIFIALSVIFYLGLPGAAIMFNIKMAKKISNKKDKNEKILASDILKLIGTILLIIYALILLGFWSKFIFIDAAIINHNIGYNVLYN